MLQAPIAKFAGVLLALVLMSGCGGDDPVVVGRYKEMIERTEKQTENWERVTDQQSLLGASLAFTKYGDEYIAFGKEMSERYPRYHGAFDDRVCSLVPQLRKAHERMIKAGDDARERVRKQKDDADNGER
jgi:hypothetical protein